MSEKLKNVIEWIECIVIAVVLALLIRYYVGTPTVVQMESMYPTLKQGERLILNPKNNQKNSRERRYYNIWTTKQNIH